MRKNGSQGHRQMSEREKAFKKQEYMSKRLEEMFDSDNEDFDEMNMLWMAGIKPWDRDVDIIGILEDLEREYDELEGSDSI